MICPSCTAENRDGRKFCGSCGAALAATCPSCGAATEPGERFCGECGSTLTGATAPANAYRAAASDVASASAPTAERRVVSVMFADLVGFTGIAEGRDPEDTRELLSRYFELATEVVQRYGGTIEKFIGDAVMAVWGAPVAREDDAERAVRAALDLVAGVPRLGAGVSARAGVLTGEAAVTLGATNQGMVAGDLVNTASRLQSAAEAGTVLVGEGTERAASRAIAFERLTDLTLKGKAVPVPAWRALRVVAEVGGKNRATSSLEAPFVGRDDELRLLKDLFHATNRESRPRLISVMGAAGIGKSRLAWEFVKYVDGLVERIWWHDGRSPAYGDGITFWALGEMVRERAGLLETDDEPTTRAKLHASVEEHIPDEQERHWIERSLLALFGYQAEIAAQELFAAWRTFFERLAETSPVVMVFEDFHYADPGLIDFVDHLMEWSRGAPITIITLSRPEILEKRPDWGAGKRNFTSVYLEPLPEDDMRRLLAGLAPGLPEAAVSTIVARADGVPLYAIETVRMLVADGRLEAVEGVYRPVGELGTLAVPDTLSALIASRLDGLPAADRAIVADAAVLGQSFSQSAIAAVSGVPSQDLEPSLRSLVRREILSLEADPRSPERGQYAFVQALIREVAYNTLAKRDRRSRHLSAARFFESLGNEELVGALAGHYLAAHATSSPGAEAEAAGAQARIALKAAADRATALGSHAHALNFLTQALDVTPDSGERADILDRATTAATFSGRYPDAERLGRSAIQLRSEIGERDGIVRSSVRLARALVAGGKVDEALALIDGVSAGGVAISTVDEIALSGQRARALLLDERRQEALAVADAVLDAAEHHGLDEIVADTLITKGTALGSAGRMVEGLALIRAGTELAEAGGHPSAMRGYVNGAGAYLISDVRAGFEASRAGVALARRRGIVTSEVLLLSNAALFAVRLGEWEWAVEQLSSRIRDGLASKDRALLTQSLAVIYAYRGDSVAQEVELLTDESDIANELPIRVAVATVKAALALAEGRYAEAAAGWVRVAEIKPSDQQEVLPLAARPAAWLGDADLLAGLIEQLAGLRLHGAVIDHDTAAMRAAHVALTGPVDEAAARYVQCISTAERLGLRWDQALLGLEAALLLGATHPALEPAIAGSRRILTELRATPFLERLDALVVRERGQSARPVDQGAALSVPS